MLSTTNYQWEYMQKQDGHVMKFMPRQDGPFPIVEAYPELSEYVLELLKSMNINNRFHVSLLLLHIKNNNILFPACRLEMPGPVMIEDGQKEHFIDCILDKWQCGWGMQYLAQ